MKRLTMLAAMLLTLAAVPLALAAAGPGKFETKLSGKGANTEHGMESGTWTLDLASSTAGAVELTWDGHSKVGGTYTISGSTFSIAPRKGGQCTTAAKYSFKLTGTKLTFKTITDTCSARRDVLTYGTWTKIG
jgi:hypothetical protein